MICTQCRRRLKSDATSCLCGWGKAPTMPSVGDYATRRDASLARANVSRQSDSPLVKEIREAFLNSAAKRDGLRPMSEPIRAARLPREPGSDDEEIAA